MRTKYDDLTRTEKIERVVAMPGVAVDLIDSQKTLIDALRRQVDIQAEMLCLYEKRVLEMERGDN